MSKRFATPAEIIEVKSKYPDENILSVDLDNINTSKDGNTYYLPVLCKRLVGRATRVGMKLVKQIIASSGKIGSGVDEAKATDVRIAFRRLDKETLEATDYPVELHDTLIKISHELCDAYDILCDEYLDLVNTVILPYDGTKFRLGKAKTIFNVKQTMRDATNEEIKEDKKLPKDERKVINKQLPLPFAIYRAKVPANINNGQKLGRYTKDGHQYIVFDARRATKANGYKKSVAKVRVKGQPTDLTTSNAKHFITYMSLIGGVLNFECICLSSFGISFITKFRDLHVWPHKPMTTITLDEDDMASMALMGASGYDSDVDVDEPDSKDSNADTDDSDSDFDESKPEPIKTKKSSKRKSTSSKRKSTSKSSKRKSKSKPVEEFLDDEPGSNDSASSEADSSGSESESDDKVEDSPPKIKNRTSKKLKSNRRK